MKKNEIVLKLFKKISETVKEMQKIKELKEHYEEVITEEIKNNPYASEKIKNVSKNIIERIK